MKKIKLTEEQMNLLSLIIEKSAGEVGYVNGDMKEYGDTTENGIVPDTITSDDGTPTRPNISKSRTDNISSRMTPQSYWATNTNGRRLTAY